jgi:anti-sigma factor RsiW
MLHPYLDGELDRAGVGEIEAHLVGCPDCRTELDALQELRSSVRRATRHRAPRALREQLRAIDDLPGQDQRVRGVQQWRSMAMAASVLLAFVLGSSVTWLHMTGVTATGREQALAQDLLTSHLRALAAASPVDVVSEDRHTVKPWFAGRVGESPPVEDFSEQGFPLVGGRIDYIGDERVPVIVYRHRQHVIDVYLVPKPAARDAPAPLQLNGYWLAACRVGERYAWIVSDVEERELLRFRDLLAREATSGDRPR